MLEALIDVLAALDEDSDNGVVCLYIIRDMPFNNGSRTYEVGFKVVVSSRLAPPLLLAGAAIASPAERASPIK